MIGRFLDLPLRFQIAIPFSVLMVAMVVLAFGFGLPFAQRSVEEETDLKLDNARIHFLLTVEHEADKLYDVAALLAASPEIAQAVGESDVTPPIPLSTIASADVIQVSDGRGTIRLDVGGAGSLDMASWGPLRQSASSLGEATGFVSSAAGPLMLVVRPIQAGGYLVVGARLDRLLGELRDEIETEMEFSLYSGERLVASTFDAESGGTPAEVATAPVLPADFSEPLEEGLVVGGHAYSVVYDSLNLRGEPETLLGVFLPKSQGWSLDTLAAVAVVALLVTGLTFLVLGFLIARSIAARLERMVGVIEKIGGGDLSQRVSVDSADEVGRLGQVVNSMASELQEVERGKAAFFAMASHELRTPLALMKNSTELLLEGIGNGAQETRMELLDILSGNIERMNRRVSDLLDLARLDAGDFRLMPSSTDVRRLLRDVAEHVGPMMAAKGQTLEVKLPARVSPMTLDPDRIQQVLLNLLGNASRHSPPNTAITLRLKNRKSDVLVEVEDNGPGIPLERLEILFDPTRRPSSKGGAGLGLLIAQRLVRLHGGEIWAESRQGEGSLFAFTLPRTGKQRELISHEDPSRR